MFSIQWSVLLFKGWYRITGDRSDTDIVPFSLNQPKGRWRKIIFLLNKNYVFFNNIINYVIPIVSRWQCSAGCLSPSLHKSDMTLHWLAEWGLGNGAGAIFPYFDFLHILLGPNIFNIPH